MIVKITHFLGAGDPVRDGAWSTNLIADLSQILFYIFAVVGAVSIIYAAYLGFLLAKATDEGKRAAAKKRIHHAVASLMIIVLLVTAMFTVGFTEAFFQNVRDINYYSLSKTQVMLGDIKGGAPRNTVSLVQNTTTLTDNVEFKISAEESGHGHSHSSDLIHITPGGILSADSGASGKIIYIFVDVSYKGETKLTHKMITIYDETSNPIDEKEPTPPFIPTVPGDTLPEPQTAMFQNPVDYKSTPSDLEYYGSGTAPYVMSNFLDASGAPAYSSPSTLGTTSSSLGVLAEEETNPHVLHNRLTGIVFHNMGATYNSRDIYAARIGEVTAVYNGVPDDNSSAYSGYGNYIEIRHEVEGYNYGFDIHKWVIPLIKGKIIVPTGEIADNLLGKKRVFYTRYHNLKQNSINVRVGDIVGGKAGDTFTNGRATTRPYGQAIATMGKTGYLYGGSNTNQMYFQVYTYVDARNWLSSLIGQAFDLITGDDGGKYTHTVYINPFKDDEVVFVDNSDLAKQIKKAKKKKKAWIVYDVNGGYQMFNGAGGLIDSILKNGYKSLFNKDIQEAITALENGDFKQFAKKEVRELLGEDLRQELENFLYQKVADALGIQYSSVLKKIVDGNFKGLINPAITGDLTQLLSFTMRQIIDEELLIVLDTMRSNLGNQSKTYLDTFLNSKVEFVLEMLDAEERIANGEIPGPLTVPQRALQQAIAGLKAEPAFANTITEEAFLAFQTVLRLDLNDLINGNQFAYKPEARSYVATFKALKQGKVMLAIPRNIKHVIDTGDWTSVLNPELQVAAQNVLDGNMESLLDGGLNGALNVLDQSGSLSKLLNFDYKGLIDEINNFSIEGELERQIRIIVERVLSPEIYQVLEAIWEDNWWSLVKPEVKSVVDLVMGKPVKDVISDALRAKLEAVANDPTNNLTPTQRTYIRIFLDAGLKQVLKFARNNAPDENDILDQDVKNAIDLMKNEDVMSPNFTQNEYKSIKIVVDVDFSKLFPKVVEDPEENEKLIIEEQNALEAFKNVQTEVKGDEVAPLYDGTVFVDAAKNVTEGFVTDLWLCKGTCGSQWTNYSDYDPPYCKYCKSYNIQNISASQNMTELLNPPLRDAIRKVRDVGLKDLISQGWDEIVEAVGKLKTAFSKISTKFKEFSEKIETEEGMKDELQKVMKTLLTPDSYSVFEDVTNGDYNKLLDGDIQQSLESFFKIQMRDIIADDLKTALGNIRGQLAPAMQEHLDTFLSADVYAMLNYNNLDGKEQTPEQIATQIKLNAAITALKAEPKFSTMGMTMYQIFLTALELDFVKFTSGETEYAYNTSARTLITKLMVLFDIIRDFSGKPLQDVLRDLSFTDMWQCNYCGYEWENLEEGTPSPCIVCHSPNIKKKPIDSRLMAIFPPSIRNAIDNAMKGDFSEILNGDLDRAIDTMGGFGESIDILFNNEESRLQIKDFVDMAKNIDLTQMLSPDAAYVFKDLFNIDTWNYVKDKFNYIRNGGLQKELKRLGQDARDLWRDSKDAAIKFVKQDLKDYFKSDEFESDILSLFSPELKDAVAVYKNVKGGFENGWKTPDGEMDWGAIKDAANGFVDLIFNGGWTSWKTAKDLNQKTTKDGTPSSFKDAFNEAYKDLAKGLEEHVENILNQAMAQIYGFVYKCSNGHQSTIMPDESKCKTCGETVKQYTFSCDNGHLFETMPSNDKCPTCSLPVKQLGLNGILHSLDNRVADIYMGVLGSLEGDLLTVSTELNTATKPVGDQIVEIVDKYIKMSEIMETMLIALAQEYYTARANVFSSVAIINEDTGATSGESINYENSILLLNIRGGEIRYYENDDGTRVEVPAHIAPGKKITFLNEEELKELIAVLLTDNYLLGELRNDAIEEMFIDDPDNFKIEENEEDGSTVLFHKVDDEWEEISLEDFLTNYETDIQSRYEAKLAVFLQNMETYVVENETNCYTGVDPAIQGLDRLGEVSNKLELRAAALYMLNHIFGGDPTAEITKDTCLKIKNNWWKKVFKVICNAIGWIAAAVVVIGGLVIAVAACFTGLGAILAPFILQWWVLAIIGVVSAAGYVGAANTDRIIPDKVVIGGDISIEQHAKRIVGDPADFPWAPQNAEEMLTRSPQEARMVALTEIMGYSAAEIFFGNYEEPNQEELLAAATLMFQRQNFDKEDYSKRILKFYITKIDEGFEDDQKISGKIMGDAASELIEPRVDEMQGDIDELMDKELVELNKKLEDIVDRLGDKTTALMKAELKKMQKEVDEIFDKMLLNFEGLGGDVKDLFSETLEDLVQDLSEVLVEMLLKELLGDMLNSFCGDLSGVMSLIFPPDPISWYYPYERAIQIDVVEGVLAYFGLGGKWADVVQSVVRNVPYTQHYQPGAAIPPIYG